MKDTEIIYILIAIIFSALGYFSSRILSYFLRKKDHQDDSLSYCKYHKKEFAKAKCCICLEGICGECVKSQESLNFCIEHLTMFNENKWISVTNLKTSSETPEKAVYIYDYKAKKWQGSKTPSYILTHYRINTDSDIIESYVMLYVREKDELKIREELKSLPKHRLS